MQNGGPNNVSKIIFNPLLTLHLIADSGVMTAIGVRRPGCSNAVQPKVMQIICLLVQENFSINASVCLLPWFHTKIPNFLSGQRKAHVPLFYQLRLSNFHFFLWRNFFFTPSFYFLGIIPKTQHLWAKDTRNKIHTHTYHFICRRMYRYTVLLYTTCTDGL